MRGEVEGGGKKIGKERGGNGEGALEVDSKFRKRVKEGKR